MLNDPNNQIPGSSSNPNNNSGSSTQPSYNCYPNFQTSFANPEELSLFNQWKMQNQFSQIQQQQPNQATASQPQSDQQSFHLVDETEDENEEEPIPTPTSKKTSRGPRLKSKATKNKEKKHKSKSRNELEWCGAKTKTKRRGYMERTKNMLTGKWTSMNASVQKFNQLVSETLARSGENDEDWMTRHKWKNSESTNARRNRFRVTDEEPEHFGNDVLPRPPGLQRIAKSQRSGSNSTASSGSNPMMYQEFMKEQYELDRKAKMQVIEQESEGAKAVNPFSKDCGRHESATNRHTRDGSGRRRYH
ncbi:hypothetical protein Tco_1183482 [Tanacetum coccineum]